VIQTIQLQVKTDLNELVEVLAWFNQLHQDYIPKIDWLKCQTALAEAFTNVVRHAHKNLPYETAIKLEASLASDYLEFKIWDYGAQYDLDHEISILPDEVEETAIGGRGLYLLKEIADRLSYTRTGDRNCLLLVKNYSPITSEQD
jgi:serine/threonine-protein kinase RsbW